MQSHWICPSGTQRFCKNDSDSSPESLIVSRVILWKTWLDSSHHFSQRDLSRVRVNKNRDSSRVIDSSYAITAFWCPDCSPCSLCYILQSLQTHWQSYQNLIFPWITIMCQEKGHTNSVNLKTWHIKEQTCVTGHNQGPRIIKHNVQSLWIWETPLNQISS